MRGLTLAIGLVALAGCVGVPGPREQRDGAPAYTPADLATLPDPEVRDEPRSQRGNHSPYVVNGQAYQVWATGRGYDMTGRASWYGTKFHGRLTSSGEPYDMFRLTAAHRHLPIPSYVRVTNLDNGASTIVRVNDRGPFHGERIIDLSYAAAVKLGFARAGTARVRVTTVAPQLEPIVAERIFLQAGAFSELDSADRISAQLREIAGDQVYVVRTRSDRLFRVRIGPFSNRDDAERLQALVAARTEAVPVIIEE